MYATPRQKQQQAARQRQRAQALRECLIRHGHLAAQAPERDVVQQLNMIHEWLNQDYQMGLTAGRSQVRRRKGRVPGSQDG